MWGQERSSTSKWRRHGNRTDERTCTLLEIIGDLVEVEEIGIYTSPPPPHTHTKRQENGQEKQGYQQENKGINKRTSTRFYGKMSAPSSSPSSRQLQKGQKKENKIANDQRREGRATLKNAGVHILMTDEQWANESHENKMSWNNMNLHKVLKRSPNTKFCRISHRRGNENATISYV